MWHSCSRGLAWGGAKLWYDRHKKRFYLLVSVEIETPAPALAEVGEVIGIDVAQRERRLKLNTNHTISKQIVAAHTHAFIGLEDLTHIRDRTKRRKKRRQGKQVVPVSVKARKANRHDSQWAFAELQACLTYKAQLSGSVCISVDADYTSQTCPRCGFASKANRKGGGLLFVCQQCHYTLHADLVGARNILLRALCIRQDWVHTGQLSDVPDVTDREDIRCTPLAVCRIAVESGHKLLPVQGSESLTVYILYHEATPGA